MNVGAKEMIAILAVLVIIFMTLQGSQETQVVVLDRQPEYIPTPVFIGGGPRRPQRRRGHHGHHGHHGPHHGPKIVPIKPIKPPILIPKIPIKIPIKKLNKDLVPGGGDGGGYPGDPYPGL